LSNAQFGRVLADIQEADARYVLDDERVAGFINPVAGAAFPVGEVQTRGGASHWDEALAWVCEQVEAAATPEPSPSSLTENTETIFRELGLDGALTHDELNQVRRLFMWRNHPDRHGEPERGRASRRSAIANMLIDSAQAQLVGGRQKRS
jgi:hypothetical protein